MDIGYPAIEDDINDETTKPFLSSVHDSAYAVILYFTEENNNDE